MLDSRLIEPHAGRTSRRPSVNMLTGNYWTTHDGAPVPRPGHQFTTLGAASPSASVGSTVGSLQRFTPGESHQAREAQERSKSHLSQSSLAILLALRLAKYNSVADPRFGVRDMATPDGPPNRIALAEQ